ncbi:MAG: hypothetical protein AB1505_07470 [Candidatus Latescibacterota bacterium]
MAEILINRAPVFTLWGAVVAERLGYAPDEALSLARVMAGLTAQKKGRRLGIFEGKEEKGQGGKPRTTGLGEDLWITLCDRPVPARRLPEGIRGVQRADPEDPAKVRKYLEQKLGEHYPAVRQAMEGLAASFSKEELEARAYRLYERFRPAIPEGRAGWGAKGKLDLELVRSLGGKG